MSPEPTRPTLRQVASQVPLALRWVWASHRPGAVGLGLVTVVMGVLPAAMTWVGREIIDGVIVAAKSGQAADRQAALQWMGCEFALALTLVFSRRAQSTLRNFLRATVGNLLNRRLLDKALRLELWQFEDARTYDLLQNAQRDAPSRPISLVISTLLLARSLLTLASLGYLLWGLAWWSVVPLVLTAIPEFFIETRLSGEAFRLSSGRAQDSRRLTYLEWALTRDGYAKEVKLFGLGPLFLGRHQALFERFLTEDQALARKQLALGTFFAGLSSLAFYACYAAVGWRAALGLLGVGDLTLSIGAFRQGQGAVEDVLSALAGLYDDALYVSNVGAFLDLPDAPPKPSGGKVLPEGRFSIELDGVTFRYPGRPTPAIEGLSLSLAAGEKLAIVGENGAGKSTLIKLLLGLYQPTAGVIRFGGVDLRELDEAALRPRLGAVFQDFVHFQLTAGENVGLGDVARLADPSAIAQAAVDGGAAEVLGSLPSGPATVLGTWFESGVELSGGQWQKLAVARGFMRLTSRGGQGADLLVLDEPTAAIDAAAEAALFERIKRLTVGRTAVLISHRFSTVRMADRIAVLEHGKLVELGTHDELVAKGGQYARLFTLQAQGYR